MTAMTIKEFCDLHGACRKGREWALETGAKNMAELWARDDVNPEWRIWIVRQEGVLDDKTLRLFACWCVRQVWDKLTDERSRNAVEVAERYAHGKATDEELSAASEAASEAAWSAARSAARNAARSAARSAESEAARSAARSAASEAASDAAWSAARSAARSAASAAWNAARSAESEAASDAAWSSERSAQAQYLIKNTTPDFPARKEG